MAAVTVGDSEPDYNVQTYLLWTTVTVAVGGVLKAVLNGLLRCRLMATCWRV